MLLFGQRPRAQTELGGYTYRQSNELFTTKKSHDPFLQGQYLGANLSPMLAASNSVHSTLKPQIESTLPQVKAMVINCRFEIDEMRAYKMKELNKDQSPRCNILLRNASDRVRLLRRTEKYLDSGHTNPTCSLYLILSMRLSQNSPRYWAFPSTLVVKDNRSENYWTISTIHDPKRMQVDFYAALQAEVKRILESSINPLLTTEYAKLPRSL